MNWDFKGQTVYHMIKRKKSIAGRRNSVQKGTHIVNEIVRV